MYQPSFFVSLRRPYSNIKIYSHNFSILSTTKINQTLLGDILRAWKDLEVHSGDRNYDLAPAMTPHAKAVHTDRLAKRFDKLQSLIVPIYVSEVTPLKLSCSYSRKSLCQENFTCAAPKTINVWVSAWDEGRVINEPTDSRPEKRQYANEVVKIRQWPNLLAR